MKTETFTLQRFDADDNKIFDWANLEAHQHEGEDGEIIQEHLYAKTIFIGANDTIDNYIEIDAPVVVE